ncbi:MAG: ABC transporter substrate-binding protein [Candidatus Hodarchaeota archaeon]
MNITRRSFIKTVTMAGWGVIATSFPHLRVTRAAEEQNLNPIYGGVLYYRLSTDPGPLDAHRILSPSKQIVMGQCYNRLLRFDANRQIIPDLAESWQISADGREYVFSLRKGVKFHDKSPVNGRELTSADVKATFVRILGQNLPPLDSYFRFIKDIDAVDKHVVKFTLKEPLAPFLYYVAMPYAWIIPRELEEEESALEKNVIGTGAFRLEEYIRGDRLVMRRHKEYFRQEYPYLDGITFLIISDNTGALHAFRKGEIDLLPLPEAIIKQRVGRFVSFAAEEYSAITMRNDIPPFNDSRVRHAISLAINRDEINEKIAFGLSGSTPIISPALKEWALPLREIRELYAYDPERAKKLLAKAGYPKGFKAKMWIKPLQGRGVQEEARLISEMLSRVGVKVRLTISDPAVFSAALQKEDYEMIFGKEHFVPEPDAIMYNQFHSRTQRNYSKVNDPILDELLEQQRKEIDKQKRVEILHGIQRYIAEKSIQIPILHTQESYLIQPNIFNFGVASVHNKSFEELWKGFVERVKLQRVSMDYDDPNEPTCIVIFSLREISNIEIEIYSSTDPSRAITTKKFVSVLDGNRCSIRIPFLKPDGEYFLSITAYSLDRRKKSPTDRMSFTVKRP